MIYIKDLVGMETLPSCSYDTDKQEVTLNWTFGKYTSPLSWEDFRAATQAGVAYSLVKKVRSTL